MPNYPIIHSIFSKLDVKYGISLFSDDELNAVEASISKQGDTYFIKCQIKNRNKIAKPEEIVRQLFIKKLLTEYNYPKERIDIERIVIFGSRESGLADITVLHTDLDTPLIIFEVKRPRRKDGLGQLKSYCNAEGAPIGVWSNGNEMIRLHRDEPNLFTEIPRIPKATETLRDILTERWTLNWLEEHDELKKGKTTLKKIILDLQELVLGNAGVKSFDEIFKLVYAKLYDEWKGINDSNYQLEFFVGDRSPEQVKAAITGLLDGAKRTWSGVFEPTEEIILMDTHLKVCVSFLEKIKLFNSNLRVIDEAFEYLIPDVAKKKEGQFFTPRPVEDMVVKMLNPLPNEFLIDPACGSAGFLLHSIMWIAGGVITGKELPTPAKNFAQNNVFGIDFAKEAVKIAKAINLIVGDGKAHIFGGSPRDNSLNPQMWSDGLKAGLRSRLVRFPNSTEKDRENQNKFLYFDYELLMTNPPFAGTVKERRILRLFRLAEKNGRLVKKIGRHILFLERSLQFIKPGGRMAIILPQGLLNNTSMEYIRKFIISEARILAVVGLHGNTFKPHTSTKTSVLLLQKFSREEKSRILTLKTKHEADVATLVKELNEKYGNVTWQAILDENELPHEVVSFLDYFFGGFNVIEELKENREHGSNNYTNNTEARAHNILKGLIEKNNSLAMMVEMKKEELTRVPNETRKSRLKVEITVLKKELKTVNFKISAKTLGGQIWLILNNKKITTEFRKLIFNQRFLHDINYPIFFAVNQKPLKDSKGEYTSKRGDEGELLLDKNGHPLIDHDLNEIADAFVRFAKTQNFDFWKNYHD